MKLKFKVAQMEAPVVLKVRQEIADWIKGIAIILMVYGHITHVGTANHLQRNIVEIVYTFHMPVFLIISGFFLNICSNIYDATHKLFRRIFLPYLIFICLYLIGLILIQKVGIHTNNSPPTSVIEFIQIILIHPIGGYWFLHSLVMLQMTILVSRYLVFRCNLEESSTVFIAFCLITLACLTELLLTRTVIFFAVGIVLRKFMNEFPTSIYTGFLLLIIVAFAGTGGIFTFSLVQVAWALTVMYFLAGLGVVVLKTATFTSMVWIGQNSLIILLLHAMFIVLSKPLANYFLKLDSSGVTYSIIVTLVTVFGSLMAAKFFDKLNFSRFFFGVDHVFIKRTIS